MWLEKKNERKAKIVTLLTKGVEFLFKKNSIEWVKGSGRLAGQCRVEVAGDAGVRSRSSSARRWPSSTPSSCAAC